MMLKSEYVCYSEKRDIHVRCEAPKNHSFSEKFQFGPNGFSKNPHNHRFNIPNFITIDNLSAQNFECHMKAMNVIEFLVFERVQATRKINYA